MNLDAVTTWAGVIAGPEPSVVKGDLDRMEAIGGMYDNYRWGEPKAEARSTNESVHTASATILP